MKSLRDLVRKMPETKKGLEDYVLVSAPHIREAIERTPEYRSALEESVNESFDRYEEYLGGLTHKISSAGHAVGYTADAWLATGDIVGSLGGKFINLLAQIPEKAYSIVYAARTGNYIDSMKNIFEGVVSYIPGFTLVDEGLSRIIQKRMVSDVVYNTEKKLGLKHKPWHQISVEKARENGYDDVKDRSANVIKVNFDKEKLRKAA
ncbi:hypothetical protein HY450_00420 [Candidatus Pacearchaeota archaeon]|nr:hypothetical protein [Candidatus Pacearchaeota archaeon]